MTDISNRQIGTLARGLMVLDCIRTSVRPLSLAEIADACQLDASTTHRLLQVLVSSGYVLRDDKTKKHIGSPKLLFPLSLYSPLSEFRREASATANRLKDQIGQTVGFVLFVGDERIILDISYGKNSLTVGHDTWLKSPIHASVSGKLLILSKGDDMRRYIESLDLNRLTEATICDPKELEQDLLDSYERGFVVVRNEHVKGLTAIGAPIWNMVGACIGCLFLNARSSEISTGEISKLGELLSTESELFTLSTSSTEPVSHMFNTHEPTSFHRSSYGPASAQPGTSNQPKQK